MAYAPKEGSGALFRNRKDEGTAQPDFRGDLLVGGVLYRLVGWTKETKDGRKFLSLAAQPDAPKPPAPAPAPVRGGMADLADDIPF